MIDEVDRADQELEAFLLELLSDFQVTVPELGTIRAEHVPIVILTSNRTREIHDALKRRCLYYWIDFPTYQKEYRILSRQGAGSAREAANPDLRVHAGLARGRSVQAAGNGRDARLGAGTALASARQSCNTESVDDTLGVILKYQEDVDRVRGDQAEPTRSSGRPVQQRSNRRRDPGRCHGRAIDAGTC